MSIYDSKLWFSDLDEIIKTLPELSMLSGQRVMITGCTGLIGSAVADVLIRWNETHDEKVELLLAGRDEKRVRDRFAPFFERDWLTFCHYDAASYDNRIEESCDYIIHGAGNGTPGKIIAEPVETMISNFEGMRFLLDYARKHAVKRCVFISSSEVYGQSESDKPRKLGDYGGIDILDPRSSYSIGKQAAETLCVSYFHEYGVQSSIIRPGHVYGPTATAADNRVSQVWAFNAARGEDIVMKSDGAQIRSYCYCLDCAAAI
ncbi:MAG: NAD-dependent epimerase/dehydratase family protein, partial [Lachnospiraceae bacterium]|nr:NAD-dependent epimerase/dehydratase family protein [Lachnospiraceae bacterium]